MLPLSRAGLRHAAAARRRRHGDGGAARRCSALLGSFGYASSQAFAKAGQHAVLDIRTSLYRHLQSLDMAFFDRRRTGELMSRWRKAKHRQCMEPDTWMGKQFDRLKQARIYKKYE
ncbi:hypothetical protein B8V81_0422 [Paenibacillus pasadenensis]|uniref:ABC transmembrane type-1 domain-containing protein n=1 Tax=Paenibacillus pasadenensis TaxID=217090 RepID=A0A2N5NDE8_9BACL|nr:ABC transporter transmembrane domain-containing protein [Paenibacillus pasadenensis]PLT48290.1 hypothetical protein B8V81_0422 [Paenibacillus pasadenensis]